MAGGLYPEKVAKGGILRPLYRFNIRGEEVPDGAELSSVRRIAHRSCPSKVYLDDFHPTL